MKNFLKSFTFLVEIWENFEIDVPKAAYLLGFMGFFEVSVMVPPFRNK